MIAESIHDFDTQLNEALNMAIARACPKFKHMGQTLTLQTRVAMIASIKNKGYKNYHDGISDKLQMQQSSLMALTTLFDDNKDEMDKFEEIEVEENKEEEENINTGKGNDDNNTLMSYNEE